LYRMVANQDGTRIRRAKDREVVRHIVGEKQKAYERFSNAYLRYLHVQTLEEDRESDSASRNNGDLDPGEQRAHIDGGVSIRNRSAVRGVQVHQMPGILVVQANNTCDLR
jgi:hypothetical protein